MNVGSSSSELDRLILEAATGAQRLTGDELRPVLEQVARSGFPPGATSEAHGLSGIEWQGRILRRRDRITAEESHYLRHVVRNGEWPAGTTLEGYRQTIAEVILDERSGAFTSRLQGRWQLGIVRLSADLRGPGGFEHVLVEYRVGVGHWMTAFQPRDLQAELRNPRREQVRWLRPLP